MFASSEQGSGFGAGRLIVAAAAIFFLAAGLLIAWPGGLRERDAATLGEAAMLRERLARSESARQTLVRERDEAVATRDTMNRARAAAVRRAERIEAEAAARRMETARVAAARPDVSDTHEPPGPPEPSSSSEPPTAAEPAGPRPFGARTLPTPVEIAPEVAAAALALAFLERHGVTSAGGSGVTLTEVAAAAEAELATTPLALASARLTIGLAHAARGAPADAVTPLRAAWATRDATLGPEHPDTIRAALALGTVEADVGLPAAQDRLREAVQRSPARDDPLYRTAVDRLSGLLLSAGDVAAAEPLVRAAWETHRGTPASEESVRVAERLARIELSRGRRGEAALLLEGVLASAAGRAADEATVLEHHATLARIYRDLDRPAAAMPHARFVLESRQRSSGDDDDATLDALDEVARLELDLGRAAEAERLFVKSLSIRERRHGRAAPAVLAVQDEIALVTLVRGRSEEAIDRCRATIALRQAAGTDEGWRAAFTRSTLGAALATSPQHRAEGEPLLREACLHLGDVDSAPPRVRRWACGWLERLGL